MRHIMISGLLGFFLLGCSSIEMQETRNQNNVSASENPSTPQEKTVQVIKNDSSVLPGIELFSFAPGEPAWYTVDDDVMGGVSSSGVEIVEPNILFFSGNMSLENNGGFSSVRSDWNRVDLSDYDGVLLRVLGDGKVYRLRIRTAETGGDITYNGAFETRPDKWTNIYIPFANMLPTYRGFVMDVDQLDAESIGSFGFMLSDKQAGDFGLQVDWIRAVSEEELQAFSQ